MRSFIAFVVIVGACGGDEGTTDPTTATTEDVADETTGVDVALPDIPTQPDVAIGDQPLAGICQNDAQCSTGFCNTFPSGGYCTLKCTTSTDCGDGAECLQDTVAPNRKEKVCLKSCTKQGDCRDDQFCPPEADLCLARCQPDSCQDGYVCQTSTGRCVTAPPCEPVPEVKDGIDQDCDTFIDEGFGPAIAQPAHVILHDFGQVQLGGSGVSRGFSFYADEGTVSFTIIVLNVDHPETFQQLYGLVSPSGVDLIGGGDPYAALNPAFPSFTAYTVQVPNSDLLAIEPGRYGFSIYSFPDDDGVPAPTANGWVYVLENRRNALNSKLDVNYWFVGIPDMDASKAQTDPRFKELLGRFEEILADAGITIGSRRYLNVTGADAQRYTIVDTGDSNAGVDEHAELLAKTKTLGADNAGVSFFFVQGFTGWDLLGKAGGIPGPPMVHGTYNSGVVVSLADYLNWVEEPAIALELTAETMAHELAHQLGLYHVTEGDGEHFDPISDTLQCPRAQNDANGDGLMDPQECVVRGAGNLMFWAASLGTDLTLGQRKVIHKNPTLHD